MENSAMNADRDSLPKSRRLSDDPVKLGFGIRARNKPTDHSNRVLVENRLREKTVKLENPSKIWVQKYGSRIISTLREQVSGESSARIDTLRSSPDQSVFQFSCGKEMSIVKAFHSNTNQAEARYRRELAAARIYNKTGLTAQAVGYNDQGQFIIFDVVDGKPVSTLLEDFGVIDIARAMGDWYGALRACSPEEPFASTWYDYLKNYSEMRNALRDPQPRRILEEMEISTKVLCRNDAHPSNFILGKDGRLTGVDFEAAAMKPEGWDLMLAARYLSRRSPRQIAEITSALVEGWGGGFGPTSKRRFLWLLRFFAESTAFRKQYTH